MHDTLGLCTCCQGHFPPQAWNPHGVFFFPPSASNQNQPFREIFLCKTEPSAYSNPQIFHVFPVFLPVLSTLLHDLCKASCLSQEKWDQPAAACIRIAHCYSFSSYQLTHCKDSTDLWQKNEEQIRKMKKPDKNTESSCA